MERPTPSPLRIHTLTRCAFGAGVLLLLALAACSDDARTTPPPGDALEDAGASGEDASPDDAAADAASDTSDSDASPGDVAPDAPPEPQDTGADAAPDVTADTGPRPDTGIDAQVDAEAPEQGPLLIELSPARGSVHGDTPILFVGTGFTEQTTISIGSRPVQRLTWVSATQMAGLTPPGLEGPATVKVVNALGEDLLPGGFVYFLPLEITSVSPRRVSTEGGVVARVRGEGFDPDVQVTVGGRSASGVRFLGSDELEVLLPPGEEGLADVRVTNRNTTATLVGGVEYVAPVLLERLFPAAGPTAGGNVVQAYGRGFTPDTRVSVGGIESPSVSVVSSQEVRFVAPPGAPGFANVALSNASGTSGLVAGYLYRDAAPDALQVEAILPGRGPASGGTRVTVVGAGLDDPALVATLGGGPLQIERRSPTSLLAVTPPGAVGLAALELQAGERAASLDDAWRYVEDVTLTGVSPASGPAEGGNVVTLQGTGFTGDLSARFAGLEAEVLDVTPTTLRVRVPEGSAGPADVEVIRDQGEARALLPQGYTWVAPIEVWGSSPGRGSVAGGTLVSIRGRGFAAPPVVRFGSTLAAEVQRVDAATLVVRAPPAREGTVDITLDFGDGPVRSPDRFTFYNPGTAFGGVWGDAITGAVNVTVLNTGLAPVEGAYVTLSVDQDTPWRGYTNAQGQVTFSGEDLRGEQTVTAVAAGHSSATVQSFNAENVTVFLSPLDGEGPPPGGPPLGTIRGRITGVDKVAEPGPNEFELALVYTTQPGLFEGNPPPGNGNVVLGNGEYTLTSRVGDVAVIGIAGLYNNQTDTFTPYYMDVHRGLFVAQDQTYTVNLDMDIPLNQSTTFKLRDAPRGPNGPNENRVLSYLDFGYEGVFQLLEEVVGPGEFVTALHQPRLQGELEGVTYTFLGGAWTNGDLPYSLALLRGVPQVQSLVELPQLVGVPLPLNPADNGRVMNGYVEFEPNGIAPDFYYILLNKPDNTPVWTLVLPGDEPYFQLPAFPDFSELPPEERPDPLVGGQLFMTVYAARAFTFDYDRFNFNDFSLDNWEAFSATGWVIRLR